MSVVVMSDLREIASYDWHEGEMSILDVSSLDANVGDHDSSAAFGGIRNADCTCANEDVTVTV